MAFEWLAEFQRGMTKDPGYAEKTLAAYRLGMRAGGSIAGVAIRAGPDCCDAARGLSPDEVHDPATAPRLPLPGCTRGSDCRCVYRPIMSYERPDGT
jgi:hypothetical protein